MKKNKSKMIIGKRIVTFIVAICIVGAGGYSRYLVDSEKDRIGLYVSKESDTKMEENLKKADKLSKKVDYSYLQKMCTYLPAFAESKEFTENDLKEIYVKAFKYFCMLYSSDASKDDSNAGMSMEEYNYDERNVISQDQLIKKKQVDDTTEKWVFKGSALDKFNDILGVKFSPEKINGKDVKYSKKKDEYIVYISDKLESTLECYSINTNYNEEDGSININIEKDDKKQEENPKIKRENVEIISANNQYGYKIRKISKGYPNLKKNINEIMLETDNINSRIDEILYYIKNYQYKKTDEKKVIEKIIYEGGKYGSSSLKGLIRSENKYGKYQVNREGITNVAELLGIPKEKQEFDIDTEKIKVKEKQYFIDYDDSEDLMERLSKEIHCLGVEKDKQNNCVIWKYVGLQKSSGCL